MSTSVIYPAVASGTSILAIPFTYLNPAEVVVMSRPVVGDDEIVFTGTTLVRGTDWNFGTSSTVVLTVPADGAHDYQVARVTPREAYTTQQPGAFSSAAINTNFTQLEDIEQEQDDQIGYLAQETQGALQRAVRGQLGEVLNALPSNRAGKYLAFDAGGQPYVTQGIGADGALRADLALSTGALLVGTSTGTLQSALDDIRTKVLRAIYADDYYQSGDPDDTLSIQRALNALTSTGGIVLLSAGKAYHYTALTITGNGITIQGAGAYGAGSLLCTSTTGNTITIQGQYSGLRNVYIRGAQPSGGSAPTAGFAVKFLNCYHSFFDRVRIDYMYNGVQVSGSTETRFDHTEMRYLFGIVGLQWYTPSGTGGSYGGAVTDFVADNPYPVAYAGCVAWAHSLAVSVGQVVYTNAAIYQCVVAGVTASAGSGPNAPTSFTTQIADGTAKWQFVASDITWIEQNSNSYSIRLNEVAAIDGRLAFAMRDIDNTGSSFPMWSFIWDMEADHNHYAGISLEAGQGCSIDGSWVGSQLAGPATGGNGNAIQTTAAWQGELIVAATRILGCAGHGILNGAGIDNSFFYNNIAMCGQATPNLYNGITVGAGVSKWKAIGNTIGQLVLGSGSQYGGVVVVAGSSDEYIVALNDLTGNVTIALGDGGTGTNKIVANNLGVSAPTPPTPPAWVDVTASRAAGTPYTNSTSNEIHVTISVRSNETVADYSGSMVVGGVTVAEGFIGNTYTGHASRVLSFPVPVGATYQLNLGSGGTFTRWAERR